MASGSTTQPGSSRGRLLLLGVLTLALAVRLAHWWAVRDQPFFAWLAMDSQEYDRWAQEVAAGDWLGSQVFFQAPLYPYFLAVLYTLFGRSLDAAYLAQIVLAVAGCYALYRAGREIGGERLG
ncbi:MAG TPA: glycosyltransferase family 39 protein, partial [Thermoanaerobaculia bacterium]|nr:glycosyltransferase family 39 protein [Thermoanaerobaculia bacterium]